ncbi:hypothetical protein AB0E76_07070 [Streptomyces fungicidicus]|uniref:hypothetical protein n=1 Tax=Streptomyces fungicidicus TaxID=68203 RepID=UPI0033F4560A
MPVELLQEIAVRIRAELGITGVNPFLQDDETNEASRTLFRMVAGDVSIFPTAA